MLNAMPQGRGIVGWHHNAEIKGTHGIEQGTGTS
jgi:hypothetical protein